MSTCKGRMENNKTPMIITDKMTIDELLEEIDVLLSAFKNHVRIMKVRNHLSNLHYTGRISNVSMENHEYDTNTIENLDPNYANYTAPIGMYNPNGTTKITVLQRCMKEISQKLYYLTCTLNQKRLDEREWW